jgi:prepilin-type N-terminal cleavage/methylation domain-containing protein
MQARTRKTWFLLVMMVDIAIFGVYFILLLFIFMHKMFSLKTQAFTLVEMLIVIVIIGILIVWFGSQLTGVTGAAKDIARQTNVRTMANALLTFQSTEWDYPASDNCVSSLKGKLDQYINTIPSDPNPSQTHGPCGTKWSYMYRPLSKTAGWRNNDAMIIWAAMENPKNANFVYRDDVKGLSYEELRKRICNDACDFANGTPYFVVVQ